MATIMLQGEPLRIAVVVLQATIGVVLLAAALQRYCLGRLDPWQAVPIFSAAMLLIYPDWRCTLAGFACAAVVLLGHRFKGARSAMPAPQWPASESRHGLTVAGTGRRSIRPGEADESLSAPGRPTFPTTRHDGIG